MSENQIVDYLRAIESQPWVGIQVRRNCNYARKICVPLNTNPGLGFNGAQIIYYLIFRHIQTTKNCPNLLTNLQQPRRIYARKSHLRAIESQSWRRNLKLLHWSTIRVSHDQSSSFKFRFVVFNLKSSVSCTFYQLSVDRLDWNFCSYLNFGRGK